MTAMHRASSTAVLLAIVLPFLMACGEVPDSGVVASQSESAPESATTESTKSAAASARSPGKPSAPVSMNYEIIGQPVVGRPVLINVTVNADTGPVDVYYSIADSSAVTFQPGQVERLRIMETSRGARQQLSVIPQREGRVFVNVSAEVQTPDGIKVRSMAIPIKVGKLPDEPSINGELKEGPEGETVISMPAEPSN